MTQKRVFRQNITLSSNPTLTKHFWQLKNQQVPPDSAFSGSHLPSKGILPPLRRIKHQESSEVKSNGIQELRSLVLDNPLIAYQLVLLTEGSLIRTA